MADVRGPLETGLKTGDAGTKTSTGANYPQPDCPPALQKAAAGRLCKSGFHNDRIHLHPTALSVSRGKLAVLPRNVLVRINAIYT